MASKAKVQKFDTINKATLRLGKGHHTRTGADASRNRKRAHGRSRRKQRS